MQFPVEHLQNFKEKALQWANSFDICVAYDSNGYADQYGAYDLLIAAGFKRRLACEIGQAFSSLQQFIDEKPAWLFGGLTYDLKNESENLVSQHLDYIQFPALFFFEPAHLILIKGNVVEIVSDIPQQVSEDIHRVRPAKQTSSQPSKAIECRFTKADYLDTVRKLQEQIFKGNIYETNFCIEFFSKNYNGDPLQLFKNLASASPTPFSNYFKWNDKYIMGASPERFLAKRGQRLISQPIKGTARRHPDPWQDEQIKNALFQNQKERQENVMIVDLVRNDLTRSAKRGTVKVEELFGIYSFRQVHQMISTVVCDAAPELSIADILERTFPMGSMTGAPKIKAMELIESSERTKRGIYSGAVGYIDPHGDFDFNVVIRSILYNQGLRYLSFQAGSAITYYADAEKEYDECLVKISGILEALEISKFQGDD